MVEAQVRVPPSALTLRTLRSEGYRQRMNPAGLENFLPETTEFLDAALEPRPSVAAFDCDGTLWAGDAGERFFDWELREDFVFPDRGVREKMSEFWRTRYAAYKRGEVNETTMCGEMVTLHEGIAEARLVEAGQRFFDELFVGQIFPEMRELVRRLADRGCEVWAVSSSNEWVIRAGMKHIGIPENRILAAAVEIENGIVTDRLLRVPSGLGKAEALREVVRKEIDVAFGNSRWDTEMLAMAKSRFGVNPNPDLELTARERGWKVYFPEGMR